MAALRTDNLAARVAQWRDFAVTHPWPVSLTLLSVFWLLVLIPWPSAPVEQIELVSAKRADVADELALDGAPSAELPGDPVITARHIRVTGTVKLLGPRLIVANEIEFAPSARITSPSGQLTVIATRIRGGALDVSGRAGQKGRSVGAAGQDGENGGVILVAAAQFTDVTVAANGAAAGDGRDGYTGTAGRNGFCGPRGFGLAERGTSGGSGGDAGNGGSGGLVTVWYAGASPQLHANPGKAGVAGRGGPGGRGGLGCRGVRGAQKNQSAGNEGVAGRSGTVGREGITSRRHVDFAAVVDAYQEWLTERAPPEALRERLRTLRTIEG